MSSTDLKRFLDARGLSVIDVAAATKIHPQTITRFLKGQTVQKSTLFMLETYVKQVQAKISGAKTATG